jgi:hypothetical protein
VNGRKSTAIMHYKKARKSIEKANAILKNIRRMAK